MSRESLRGAMRASLWFYGVATVVLVVGMAVQVPMLDADPGYNARLGGYGLVVVAVFLLLDLAQTVHRRRREVLVPPRP